MMILYVAFNLALAVFLAWDTARILCRDRQWRQFLTIVLALWFGTCSLTTTVLYSLLVYYAAILLTVQLLWKLVKKTWLPWRFTPVVCLVLSVSVMVWGMLRFDERIRTEYVIETDKDAQGRLVFLSDLHYPTGISQKELSALLVQLEAEHPAAYLLGGDIVDEYTSPEEARTVFLALGRLTDSAPVYYVYGNHDDQDEGILDPVYTRQELASMIEEAGIRVLADESVTVGEFELIGREDYRQFKTSRLPVSDLITDPEKFVVVIDHQPVQAAQVREAGADLLISGHTHNGQLWPFGLLIWLMPAVDQVYGYRSDGDFTQITSSGIGGWGFAVRTAGSSEYVVVDVKKSA